MIHWTSPQGEHLTLRPCMANDGRYLIEVLDGSRLLTVADLESGEDVDVGIKRVRVAVQKHILKALRRWGGRVEEKAA